MMSAKRSSLLAGSLISLLAGCGVPIQSGAHFAQAWQSAPRATFAWNDQADRIAGDSRLEGNRFFHERLHEAVEWQLSLRGIRYDENSPDLLIHHHLSLSDHVMETEVIDDAGVATTETDVYENGSVVLHIVERDTGDDLWVAWGQANIEPALVSPESMRKWVYDLVASMFKEWPVPPRAE